ncbi:hypothetical protein [Pseudonocardia lacus]|uniref:hypothetical protein n=1 Tax=Pseudonocardia lacus TaxID=2835865 RepID=UPI001BDC9A41|nr:hypothetical protein [Pseudonocardia lacus]
MWLVSGVDEEHRFREWGEAVDYYRQMVRGWVGAHGGDAGVARAIDDLPTGGAHQAVFPDPDAPDGERREVEFSIGWEVPRVGLDHFTAC